MKALFLTLCLLALPAMAELPALTASQQEKQEKESAAEKAMLEREKQALARVQERIARHYRSTHPGKESPMAIGEVTERVGKSDIPKSATQPLGKPAEPHAGREEMPQAEAHSQSAK